MAAPMSSPIAVVGIASLFPGSIERHGFWKNILDGRDLIGDVPPTHWLVEDYYDTDPKKPGKAYSHKGAFLSPVQFEPLEHGITPANLKTTDTLQLLALVVAKQVLEDACSLDFTHVDRKRTSVILGTTSTTELAVTMAGSLQQPIWQKAMRTAGLNESQIDAVSKLVADCYNPWTENTFPGLLTNVVAGRIANRFDLGGTNCVIDAACAGSLAAIRMGIQELQLGSSDLVITGGVDAQNDVFSYLCFCKTPAMSPSGHCSPFAKRADGTVLGEGVGMLALRRLSDAEQDGDHIYAVLRGLGSSSDGRAKSIYAPRAEGQAIALRRAYEAAGYSPSTVSLVEAHGTGTAAGDVAEFEALKTVFSEADRERTGWCALGSVKSQVGHTKAAAGAASLFKVVQALHHKVLPPTIKVDTPNPKLDIGSSPFYLNTALRPWIHGQDYPRRASVSSFGFGGSNYHVTVEEYVGPAAKPKRVRHLTSELFLFSAETCGALLQGAKTTVRAAGEPGAFASAALLSQRSFRPTAVARLAVVAANPRELAGQIDNLAQPIERDPAAAISAQGFHYAQGEPIKGQVAFLFPGQGSQSVDMGADLAIHFELARRAWDDAAGTADPFFRDLPSIVFPPPVFSEEERAEQLRRLTQTECAQPAIGVASLALMNVTRAIGVKASMAAGHSFGELSALHYAGVFDAATFMNLARQRGQTMAAASAAVPGAMLAVFASKAVVEEFSDVKTGTLVIANHNGPEQIIVAGPTEAISRLADELVEKGLQHRKLPVSTAFHSPLVEAASAPFREILKSVPFASPTLPVFANVSAAQYPDELEAMRGLLAGQISAPVRFFEEIEAMYGAGARHFIEVGPGNILTELTHRILDRRQHVAVALDGKGRDGIWRLWNGLAQLAVAGHEFDLSPLWDGFDIASEQPQPSSPATVQICGANYSKSYPPTDGAKTRPINKRPGAAIEAAAKPGSPAAGTKKLPAGNGAAAPAAQIARQETTPLPLVSERRSMSLPAPSAQKPESLPLPRITSVAPKSGAQPASPATLSVVDRIIAQSAEAHAVAQRAMADAHIAFLRMSETIIMQARAGHGEANGTFITQTLAREPVRSEPSSSLAPSAGSATEIAAVTPKMTEWKSAPGPAPANIAIEVPGSRATADAKAHTRLDGKTDAKPGIMALAIEVVAAKTGYPAEMLKPEMELEADLGIDSIKRVEILSAIREAVPGLPPIDANDLAALSTLGAIMDKIGASKSVGPAGPTKATPEPKAVAGDANSDTRSDIRTLALDVVAAKTGYPAEMLKPEMELEADLGIDSIKRVEILSAIQEAMPGLPPIDTNDLAALSTLGAIMDKIGASKSTDAAGPTKVGSPDGKPEPKAVAGDTKSDTKSDIRTLALDVVAAKTGYPAEMLKPEMELEADLGIDSIKRVEILSAIQEAVPDLPPIDSNDLATLSTLGAIMDKIGATHPVAAINFRALRSSTDLRRRILSTEAVRVPGNSSVRLTKICIIGANDPVTAVLAAELRKRGQIVGEGERELLGADGLILFGSSEGDPCAAALSAFNHARTFAVGRGVIGGARPAGLFVTVQDTGGDFGLSARCGARAWHSSLAALARTARREWPSINVKAIDLERAAVPAEVLATRLADEILSDGGALELALCADGRRLGLAETLRPIGTANSDRLASLRDRPVLIATGGARGVTALCIEALCEAVKPRVALFGRSELADIPDELMALDEVGLKRALLTKAKAEGTQYLPRDLSTEVARIMARREALHHIRRMRQAGAEVRYFSVDVADTAATLRAVSEVRDRWGNIDGLIHGAGLTADKYIVEKTDAQFAAVFDTKVAGLRALLDATRDDDLSVMVLFSSVSARYGNVGQCDYAMANEVLNKVARIEAASRPNCLVRAMNWGPWDSGMVTPTLQRLFRERGVAIIEGDIGAAAFVDEIRYGLSTPDEVELILGADLVADESRDTNLKARSPEAV